MTLKKLAYITYYTLVAGIIASQVTFTLYQTSVAVGHGEKLQSLQEQKNQLAAQQQKLQVAVAGHLSLVEMKTEQLVSYEAISSPIVVAVDTNLASAE